MHNAFVAKRFSFAEMVKASIDQERGYYAKQVIKSFQFPSAMRSSPTLTASQHLFESAQSNIGDYASGRPRANS